MAELGEVMFREIHEIPAVLTKLSQSLLSNHPVINKVKNLDFLSVMILARGTSDNAAHFLKYLIEVKMGLPCGLVSPSAATIYGAELKYHQTLVIALSQSGQSTDLLAFAKAAKNGGGFLISFTNSPESPLAKMSDGHVYLEAGEEIAVPATKSYLCQLLASYLLVHHFLGLNTRVEEIIKNAKDSINLNEELSKFADQIDVSAPLYILGRGYSYPNAKEFALKIQETCLVPVQGMSSSDFMHGPIASLTPKSQVIFMSPENSPESSFGDSPEKIRAITGKIFWIGRGALNAANEPMIAAGHAHSEIEASISDAILFQKIAHKIAINNGFNPDKPKGLNKITITH